jgi:hypothetical protein
MSFKRGPQTMLLKKILPLAALLAVVLPAGSAMAAPKAKVQLSAPAYAVAENAGSATITVIRPRNGHSVARLNQPVSVSYSTHDGTATAGSDYTAASGTLAFPACSGSPAASDPCVRQTFSVAVADNFVVDGPRTLTVKLSNPTSPTRRAILGYPSTAALVIADDDSTGVGSGSTFQVAAASEYVSEASGIASVYVIRSGDLASGASVHYATSDGLAQAGTDYTAASGTLNFPTQTANAVTSIIQAVPVSLIHNAATTPQLRNFHLSLDIPAGTGGTLGSPSSEDVVIVNSDGTPTLLWSASAYSTPETSSPVRVTAIAAGSITGNDEVDVDYQTVDGTAKAGLNYVSASDSLEFFADDFAESADIAVLDDHLSGDKAFTAELLNQSAGSVVGDPGVATVNVLDAGDHSNDPAPATTGTSGDTTTGGGAGTSPTTGAPAPAGGDQFVLGTRQSTCGLVVKAVKKQKLLKQKALKLTFRSSQACKISTATTIKQTKAASKKKTAQIVRALRFKGKKAAATLKPGKSTTVKVKFTKRTLKAIKKALEAHKKLVATVVVTERDAASNVKRRTLKITIRR